MFWPRVLPGWALTSVLDGSSDRFRKVLLAPALGLLLLFGVSGFLVLLDLWSPLLLAVCLAGLNAAAYRMIHQRHEVVAKRTRWQQLEAAMHGEISEDTVSLRSAKKQKPNLDFRTTAQRRCTP